MQVNDDVEQQQSTGPVIIHITLLLSEPTSSRGEDQPAPGVDGCSLLQQPKCSEQPSAAGDTPTAGHLE